MTNLLRTMHAKLYHNRSGFVEEMTKNILVFFSVHSVYCKKVSATDEQIATKIQ